MWIEHLAESTIRKIDAVLSNGGRMRANFYESDVKQCLGPWKFMRFMVMRKIEGRGWARRLPGADQERGARWLRMS